MPEIETAKQLLDLGGWGALLVVVILATIGLFRKWWVPGWMYDKAEKRAEDAEKMADRNATSLEQIARMVGGNSGDRAAHRQDAPNGP